MTHLRFLFALALMLLPVASFAQYGANTVKADIISGWQNDDGTYVAAIRIELEDGWKTYWRAPGDSGIPPLFDWRKSTNLRGVEVIWPTPDVFFQSGMRSVGYKDEVIIPIRILPERGHKDVRLKGVLDIGVCLDVCVPARLRVSGELVAGESTRNPRIVAALADRPLTASEGGVTGMTCKITPTDEGLRVMVKATLPSTGGTEEVVIETSNPKVWVSEPKTRRTGAELRAEAEMLHVDGGSFILDRDAIRVTVLGTRHAVDITGCSAD